MAKEDLAALQSQYPHTLTEVNIESDPILLKKYIAEIPVVQAGSFSLKYPFDLVDLKMTLGAAKDAQDQNSRIKASKKELTTADRLSIWIARHWLLAVNLVFIIYLGLPVMAPVLMKMGAKTPANIIYLAYSPLCHQLGFRSFYFFGEQPYYPRSAAGITGVIPFGQATGLNENDLLGARRFVGNEKLGYKMALCERDIAIYGGIILFGLLFGLFRRKIPPLNWMLWFLFAIGPIGQIGRAHV